MSDEAKPEPRSAGYGNPPPEHKFKKGRSGNPKGRPRKKAEQKAETPKTSRLADLIYQEAYRPIQIRENGKLEELPMIQAVLRSLGVAAVKGSHRAQLAVTGLVQAVEQRTLEDRQALFKSFVEYKLEWEAVFERCDREGTPRPDPVPHPDDLGIDVRAGEVYFNGPMDEGQKALWVGFLAQKESAQTEINEMRREMEEFPDLREAYADDIASEQKMVDLISTKIPDEQTRRVPGFKIQEWQDQQTKILERRARFNATRTSKPSSR